MKKICQRGFTLIELMIVIAIIGILTGLVTVNLADARERARDVQRKTDLKALQQALELYKNDKLPQTYPATATWQTDLVEGGYIKEIPADPSTASSWPEYAYARDASNPLSFSLIACLENSADPNLDPTNICAEGYSYSLTQP